jgi:hypothetical protein
VTFAMKATIACFGAVSFQNGKRVSAVGNGCGEGRCTNNCSGHEVICVYRFHSEFPFWCGPHPVTTGAARCIS